MLGELGDVDVVADLDLTRHRRQLTEKHPQQRRLARPVRPDQRDLLTPLHHQVDAAQNRDAVEADRGVDRLDHDPRRALRLGEPEPCDQVGALRRLQTFQLLEGLHPTLDLAGLGRLVAEPFDEAFGRRELLRLCGSSGLGGREAFLTLHDELGEPADVLDRPTVRDLDHTLGDRIQEVPVVTDEQDRPGPRGQVLLQPRDRLDVQVVRRFVEHQQIGRGQHQSGQRDTHAPSAREVLHRAVRITGGEAESCEDLAGLGLDAVPAERLEAVLRGAVGIQGRGVGLGVRIRTVGAGGRHLVRESHQLLFQLGDVGGAAQDLVDDRSVHLFGQLLGQVPDAGVLADVDRSGVRLLVPDDDLQQSGLADAVAPHERHTATGHQLEGDSLEQGAAPEGLGEAGDSDHRRGRLPASRVSPHEPDT